MIGPSSDCRRATVWPHGSSRALWISVWPAAASASAEARTAPASGEAELEARLRHRAVRRPLARSEARLRRLGQWPDSEHVIGPSRSAQSRVRRRKRKRCVSKIVPAPRSGAPRFSLPKLAFCSGFYESGRQDLNLRPPGPQPEGFRRAGCFSGL
jgi:hypothetical protein